jgi:hypothetical protein
VWIVSNEQLLDWVQHPVPVSQLASVNSLKCTSPQVDASKKICNGIPQNENGLLSSCPFSDFPFFTCVRILVPFVWICGRMVLMRVFMRYSMDVRRRRLHRATQILLNKCPVVNRPASAVRERFGSSLVYFILRFLLHPVPVNCSTPFWDPIAGSCICTSNTCAFADNSRPIGVNFFDLSLFFHLVCPLTNFFSHSQTART